MLRRRGAVAAAAALGLVASSLVGMAGPSDAWTRNPRRIAGIDRYQTSVDLSNAAFPSGAPAVVVASGETFPDGLAAGPLAALLGGPVLLTQHDAPPATILAELQRLHPSTILVVGGTAAVSDEVLAAVAGATSVTPERIAGDDRFATAAKVAARFPAGGAVAYVVGGMDFPDALAAGAAAANVHAPLLLVAPDSAPPAALDALRALAPSEVRIVGGAAAVDANAESQVRSVTPAVRRIAGPDRYATAQALVGSWVQDGGSRPSEVLVATGAGFPDALAAAPLAAVRRAPIVLTAQPCAPQPTVDVLRDSGWPDVIAIGGTAVVSSASASIVPCSPVPDGLLAPGLLLSTAVLPGPVVVHLVTVDRRQGYDIRAVTTTGRVNGLFPTTGAARALDALVAVNGDFFDAKGEPSHGLTIDGRILRWPGLNNTLVGFDPARPTFGFFGKPMGGVELDRGDAGDPLPIGMVNSRVPNADQLALLTPEWTAAFPSGEWCRAALATAGAPFVDAEARTVQPETVTSASCSSDPVPRDTDVLVTPPGTAMADSVANLAPGASVAVRWRLHPMPYGVLDAIGANTSLVFGKRVADDTLLGQGEFFTRREARSAIGQREDSTVVIAVVDKRPGWSIGMTPRELADFLVGMDILDAANLDGGGSSALAVRGVLTNRPSDGVERSVNSALVIVPHGVPVAARR